MAILLSPKHGLNPSMAVCFYCGEPTGEIVLPGRLKNDAEAPRCACWHKDPCEACKGWMQKGIILIAVGDGEEPGPNPYRTGGFAVVKDEAFIRWVGPDHPAIKARYCFIETSVWNRLGIEPKLEDDHGV